MPVTALYAGLIAILFLVLSWRVIARRRSQRVSLGDGDDTALRRRIRAQANCAEYAPMGLILLGAAESLATPVWVLHLLGLMLLAGRVMHGLALTREAPAMTLRVGGMLLTLGMLGLSALGLVAHALI